MAERFAHTFLFECPDCGMPISASRISEERNLETVDGSKIRVACQHCQAAAEVVGATAKQHSVVPVMSNDGL